MRRLLFLVSIMFLSGCNNEEDVNLDLMTIEPTEVNTLVEDRDMFGIEWKCTNNISCEHYYEGESILRYDIESNTFLLILAGDQSFEEVALRYIDSNYYLQNELGSIGTEPVVYQNNYLMIGENQIVLSDQQILVFLYCDEFLTSFILDNT